MSGLGGLAVGVSYATYIDGGDRGRGRPEEAMEAALVWVRDKEDLDDEAEAMVGGKRVQSRDRRLWSVTRVGVY